MVTEVGETGSESYLVIYSYSGNQVDGSLGSSGNFQFQGGKLIAKAHLGLN